LPVRFSLFLLLVCCAGIARADWTGVEFKIADIDADWEFADGTRPTKINSLSLSIEERADGGLSVGGSIGYLGMRVAGSGATDTTRFEGQNLEVYLRQEIPLGQSFALEGLLSYGYYTGLEEADGDRADITWSQVGVEVGASFRYAKLRITPFASYASVDGDIRGESGTELFELEDPYSYGLRFDIFVEPTAFITVRLQDGSQRGGFLSFVRRY
jgi:hypothetical protein